VTNPMEVVKTRLQLQGELAAKGQVKRVYTGVFQALRIIAVNEGIKGRPRHIHMYFRLRRLILICRDAAGIRCCGLLHSVKCIDVDIESSIATKYVSMAVDWDFTIQYARPLPKQSSGVPKDLMPGSTWSPVPRQVLWEPVSGLPSSSSKPDCSPILPFSRLAHNTCIRARLMPFDIFGKRVESGACIGDSMLLRSGREWGAACSCLSIIGPKKRSKSIT